MKQIHDIHYEFQTKSQIYKFTDTSLFINYKEYPYLDLQNIVFHKGNAFMNSWYSFETKGGKKLIVAYKPKATEVEKNLKTIFSYIESFDEKASAKYHSYHKEFEFLVDTFNDEICSRQTTDTILEYIKSSRQFMLSDYVFDGEIQLDETNPASRKVEISMYNLSGKPVHIGYVPDKIINEMQPFLKEGITYELRMIASGYGIRKKKYLVRALLIFDKR